jgi:hypothetical protein
MVASGSSGSVRGASSNGRPYREPRSIYPVREASGNDRHLRNRAVPAGAAWPDDRPSRRPSGHRVLGSRAIWLLRDGGIGASAALGASKEAHRLGNPDLWLRGAAVTSPNRTTQKTDMQQITRNSAPATQSVAEYYPYRWTG